MTAPREDSTQPIARVIGSSNRLVRFLEKLRMPVLAMGKRRIHQLILHGRGFALSVSGREGPLIGFFVNVWVAAATDEKAIEIAVRRLQQYWADFGYREQAGELLLEVEEHRIATEWFIRHWRTGLGFYGSE